MEDITMEKWISYWKQLMKEEDGIGTLEMLLIIAVILVVAIAFRKWIFEWVNNLFTKTNQNVQDTLNENTVILP
jgi:Flp pilus assembly pilin Flp